MLAVLGRLHPVPLRVRVEAQERERGDARLTGSQCGMIDTNRVDHHRRTQATNGGLP